jgi:RNase H-fold protein (predicted Holliday junction resolvase)
MFSNHLSKQVTQVVKGAPKNIEQRIKVRREIRSQGPRSLSRDSKSAHSNNGIDYQTQRVGMAGLKRYQCPKIMIPLEKSKKSKLTEEIHQSNAIYEVQVTLFGRELEQDPEMDQANNKISKEEMEKFLFRLGYLPYLQAKDKVHGAAGQINSSVVGVEEAEILRDNLWTYLNPTIFEKADKVKLYQIIKLLHLKAGKEADTKLQ